MRPTLSASEIEKLEQRKAIQVDLRDTLTASIPIKNQTIADAQSVDDSFKRFFDYYNTDIIGNYDIERQNLNGKVVENPITETDIQDLVNLTQFGTLPNITFTRTFPTSPSTEMVRIPEFDDGNTIVVEDNETTRIATETFITDILVNGLQQTTAVTAVTTSSIDENSTSVNYFSGFFPNFSNGDQYVIQSGANAAIIEITNFTVVSSGGGTPTYSGVVDFVLKVKPNASIGSGADFDGFGGFSNSDRVAKNTGNQNLMDFLVLELINELNGRRTNLDNQILAISNNLDPDATSELATASTNASNTRAEITAYLGAGAGIGNTDLATLETQRNVRSGQIVSRASQIESNYTGQSENFFDKRYLYANGRGSLATGTARRVVSESESLVAMNKIISDAISTIAIIDEILS